MEWMLMPLRRYADFSGRSRRKEFWMFSLGYMLLTLLMLAIFIAVAGTAFLGALDGNADPAAMTSTLAGMGVLLILYLVIGLGLIIPSIAVSVRRLHDIDRSGWWVAVFYGLAVLSGAFGQDGSALGLVFNLVYVAAAITLLVFTLLPGTRGPNRFGEDPKAAGTAEVFA